MGAGLVAGAADLCAVAATFDALQGLAAR